MLEQRRLLIRRVHEEVPPHVEYELSPLGHSLAKVISLLDEWVIHDDSLGSESILRPGGVNVMTSDGGIADAEQTPPENTGQLNGTQLLGRASGGASPRAGEL